MKKEEILPNLKLNLESQRSGLKTEEITLEGEIGVLRRQAKHLEETKLLWTRIDIENLDVYIKAIDNLIEK